MPQLLHFAVSNELVGVLYHVYNTLGYGFLEKVYQKALCIELENKGFLVEVQKSIVVYYKGAAVGQYYADIVVNDCIIIELKVCENISETHKAQLLHYLRATQYEVGYVVNFGPKISFARLIYTNDKKNFTHR